MLLPFFISTHALVVAVLNFFLPIYLATSLAFSGAQIGLLYGVLSLNSLVASFPVGVVGDRYPARILTRLGLLGTVASLWWLSRAQRFWPFLLLFFALGLSLQLYRQSLDIMLFKEDDVAQNTRRLGTLQRLAHGRHDRGDLAWGRSSFIFLDTRRASRLSPC